MAKFLGINKTELDKEVDAVRLPKEKTPTQNNSTLKRFTAKSVVEALVDELNEKFFVVESFGDQCVVCWLEDNPDPKKGKHVREEANKIIKFQSFANFAHRFEHQLVVTGVSVDKNENEKEATETKANVWIKHPRRKQYERVVFKPGGNVPPHEFNLWRGFAYEAVKGDCEPYLTHLLHLVKRKSERDTVHI